MSGMSGRAVYFVDGSRTPFLKARGKPGKFAAADLATLCGRSLLQRQPFAPEDLDEVILGCMAPSEEEANIARIVALRLGCGDKVTAWTVQRNCASGLQALDNAYKDIACGRHDLVLAGGTEAMSRAPLLFNRSMVNWLASLNAARSLWKKLQAITKFRPHFLAPVISLLKGLTDPVVCLNMGQTAEIVADRFNISREDIDAFAVESHKRTAQAQDNQHFDEIEAIYDNQGNVYQEDDGLRRDSNVAKLATLKPFFDKKFGKVTAANSSQVTDGATMVLMASEDAVKKYQLPVLGKVVDVAWAGLDPREMGLGPVHAIAPLLTRNNLGVDDIDYWEINEAFAAQALGCVKAMNDPDYCRDQLGLDAPLGLIDRARLNVDGGAIAIGHPVGSSGARITLHLLKTLQRKQARYGIASLCIGGGQGGAMLVEQVTEVN